MDFPVQVCTMFPFLDFAWLGKLDNSSPSSYCQNNFFNGEKETKEYTNKQKDKLTDVRSIFHEKKGLQLCEIVKWLYDSYKKFS